MALCHFSPPDCLGCALGTRNLMKSDMLDVCGGALKMVRAMLSPSPVPGLPYLFD